MAVSLVTCSTSILGNAVLTSIVSILALSSSLSVPDSFKSIGTTDPSTLQKAIFWAHGTADYVPISCDFLNLLSQSVLTTSTIGANSSIDYLVDPIGFKKISKIDTPAAGTVTWSAYEGLKHETNGEELNDIQKW